LFSTPPDGCKDCEICEFLLLKLHKKFKIICCPSQQRQEVIREHFQVNGFPGIIGCIEGSHPVGNSRRGTVPLTPGSRDPTEIQLDSENRKVCVFRHPEISAEGVRRGKRSRVTNAASGNGQANPSVSRANGICSPISEKLR
jgi:hypothetical protein